MAVKKKSAGKGKKAGFTPVELKFRKRFLSSVFGKLLIGVFSVALIVALAALIAGTNTNLFFLLTGIALLASIITFWVLLLFKRATGRE